MAKTDIPSTEGLPELPDERISKIVEVLSAEYVDNELVIGTSPIEFVKAMNIADKYGPATLKKMINGFKEKVAAAAPEAKGLEKLDAFFEPPKALATPKKEQPAGAMPSVAGPPREKTRERTRDRRPEAQYVIAKEGDAYFVMDRKYKKVKDSAGNEVLDDDGNVKLGWEEYKTIINLPDAVWEAYDIDKDAPEVMAALAKAGEIRRELKFSPGRERQGQKQHLEESFGDDGWPRWEIKLGGYDTNELIDPDPVEQEKKRQGEMWNLADFPTRLQRIAERNPDRFIESNAWKEFLDPDSKAWKEHLNKAKRNAIERIISEELADPRRTLVTEMVSRLAPAEPKPRPPAAPPAPKPAEPKVEPPPAAKIETTPIVADEAELYDEFEASLGEAAKTLSQREYAARFAAFRKGREPVTLPPASPAAIETKREPRRYTPEQAARMKVKVKDLRPMLIEGMLKDNPRLSKTEAELAADMVIKDELDRIDRAAR